MFSLKVIFTAAFAMVLSVPVWAGDVSALTGSYNLAQGAETCSKTMVIQSTGEGALSFASRDLPPSLQMGTVTSGDTGNWTRETASFNDGGSLILTTEWGEQCLVKSIHACLYWSVDTIGFAVENGQLVISHDTVAKNAQEQKYECVYTKSN